MEQLKKRRGGWDMIDLSGIPKLPGIYKWVNLIDGKIYIGKGINIHKRIQAYQYRIKPNQKLEHINLAHKKYGFSNFKVEVIEVYPSRTPFIEKYILEREAFWIKFYNATDKSIGYNTLQFSNDRTGIPLSEETKRKISAANKGRPYSEKMRQLARERCGDKHWCFGTKWSKERREKQPIKLGKDNPSFGKPKSEETKRKISATKKAQNLTGKKSWAFGKKASQEKLNKLKLAATGKFPSEETRKKLSERCHKNRKIAIINELTGEIKEQFNSISNACRKIGKGEVSSILKAAKSKTKTAYGFKWRLIDKEGGIIPPKNP